MDLSRHSLYPHQVAGIQFLAQRGKAILADDMGLGKTRKAIVAMNETAPTGAVLVICPASLKLNWAREIRAVDPGAAVDVLGVDGREGAPARWVIVNYDMLGRFGDRLRAIRWAGVIVDEAHFIKNASQRTSQVLKLIGVAAARSDAPAGPRQVFLLTGTPMPNRPRDLFNLLRAVGHPSSRSFLSFAKRYCGAYLSRLSVCTTSGLGLTAEFGLSQGAISAAAGDHRTALFQLLADQPHPEFGGGLFCLLQMPHQVKDPDRLAQVCLQLNRMEMAAHDLPPHFGAWCPGRLGNNPAYVSFLPNAMRDVSGIAVNLGFWAMNRAQWASAMLPALGVSG